MLTKISDLKEHTLSFLCLQCNCYFHDPPCTRLPTATALSSVEAQKDHDIYFACKSKYHRILLANEYIYKVLPYTSELESEFLMIGAGTNNPYFDYYCNLGILTQRHVNYHGIDNKVFNLMHNE